MKREEEREEIETTTVKRRCEGFVSVEAFEILSQREDEESCGGFSWEHLLEEPEDLSDCEPDSCAHVRVVLVVTDVPVSPSSVVTEFRDVSPCDSDWEFVEPQSFSFSKSVPHCGTDTQEEMRYEGSPVKALPLSRRRMTPPTPMQKFVYLLCEGPRNVRRRRKRMECERKNNYREDKTVSGKKFQREGAS